MWLKVHHIQQALFKQSVRHFLSQVSAQFSPTSAVPGEENTVQVSAQPGSLCGLTGVDQSVLIMEKDKRLNVDNVICFHMQKLYNAFLYS